MSQQENRSEKLAAARRKLKQYQQRSSSHGLSSGGATTSSQPPEDNETIGSIESLNQSIASAPTNSMADSRGSFTSLPAGFHHDEHRSPFQRVRTPSQSSEQLISRPGLQPRQSLGYESTVSEPQIAGPSLSSYFNSSDSSSTERTFVSIEKENVPEIITQQSPMTSPELLDVSNEPMENNNSSPEILSTPTLQHMTSTKSNSPLSLNVDPLEKDDQGPLVITDNSDDSHELISSPSINPASTELSASVSHEGTVDTETRFDELQQENQRLEKLVKQDEENLNHVNTQFQQLHLHYSQLHQLYSSLLECKPSEDDQRQQLEKQNEQHVQTLSVLVEEKAQLQSQLRQAMEIANTKHLENEELQGRLKANRDKLSQVEKDFDQLSSGRTELEQTLHKQKIELDKRRQDAAQWEAKVIEMQQDRSELQARIKVKSRELDKFYAEMGDMRKELQMKEIYIRQLSAHAAGVVQMQEQEQNIANLQGDVERQKCELNKMNAAVEHWKWEAQQSREQYETYGRQLNQKIVDLSQQLERVSEEKLDVDSRAKRLENELENLRNEPTSVVGALDATDEMLQTAADHVSVAETQQKLRKLEERLREVVEQNRQLSQSLVLKESELMTLQETVADRDNQLRHLNETLDEQAQCSTDTKTLLEQVQSERATVSRAVAQNKELKEQIVELQDRFVKMSEENMDYVTRIQSHEFLIEKLKEELGDKEKEWHESELKNQREIDSLQQRLNFTMKESIEKANLEQLLAIEQNNFETCKRELEYANTRLLEMTTMVTEENSMDQTIEVEPQNSDDEKSSPEQEQLEFVRAENTNLRHQMSRLEGEYSQFRTEHQRVVSENEELHRIMHQNAEDENQNTIYVELEQAINRITTLSNENETLRQQIATSSVQNGSNSEEENKVNGDDSSICSEQTRDSGGDEAVEKLKKAMDQLQNRFTRAMTENADLSDQNQQLEHLIGQLQAETDTIGEYVTIYQHQRKVIRERLKERENNVAFLSREKEETQRKLSELQDLVMNVLRDRGLLHVYAQLPPTRGRKSLSPRIRPSPDHPSAHKHKHRTFSQTTVDELSGDEETVVDGFPVEGLLAIRKSVDANVVVNGEIADQGSPHTSVGSDDILSGAEQKQEEDGTGTAERILRLLTEMQVPEMADRLPVIDRNLHCKECKGKLIVL